MEGENQKFCCPECKSYQILCLEEDDADIDLEAQPLGKNYMCEECGKELTQADLVFANYTIGKVIEVEEMKSPLKKTKVQINPETDEDAL